MQRIGRYEVLRELGRGGMGCVYLGVDSELQRNVALKLLHREDCHERARFRHEARALAALTHPNIVTIFEIGDHEGQRFIAMEYVEGNPLRDLLALPELRRDRDGVIAIFAQVVDAVIAAHAAGILHRDLKPENVIVTEGDKVRVVDFGIARRLDGNDSLEPLELPRDPALAHTVRMNPVGATALHTALTEVGAGSATRTVFGTPAYMAPEVLLGEGSAPASDVYSLGVMLYECLAGKRPHDTSNLVELIARVVDGSAHVQPLDDPLGPLVDRMLARDPARRPTLLEIAAALRPRRRSRGWAPLAGFAIASAVAIVGVALWPRDQSAAAVVPPAIIAVDGLATSLRGFGVGSPHAEIVGDILARELDAFEGIDAISPIQLQRNDARALGATWLVRGTLVDERDTTVAKLELTDLASRETVEVRIATPRNEVATALAKSAAAIRDRVRPGTTITVANRARALELLDVGTNRLHVNAWLDARYYLEQAALIDPTVPQVWTALASARAWSVAPQPKVDEAVERSIALADDGPHRQLWTGARHHFREEYAAAIAILEPLLAEPRFSARDIADVRFFLGDAFYHDGQYDRGVALLRPLVDTISPSRAAAVHVAEHSLGRRDFERAFRYYSLDRSASTIDLARGRYREVATGRYGVTSLHAHVLLGEPIPEHLVALYPWDTKLARYAAAPDARTFEAVWRDIAAADPNAKLTQISELFEVAILAERAADLRAILAHVRSDTFRGRPRFEILAAPILGDARRFDRAALTTRQAALATAIEAELARDHARAAKLLRAVVDEPGPYWDYPERGALARNLAAAGAREELARLCADTETPAIFRMAWVVLARTCRASSTRREGG